MAFSLITHGYAILSLVALLLVFGLAMGFFWSRLSAAAKAAWDDFRGKFTPLALLLAWLVAMLATLGSLYFSEIAGLVPCQLCWFQRIAMYPLALLLGIAAFRLDVGVAKRYFIWLPLVGALISAYHYQLERFPLQPTLSCGSETPCSVPVFNIFGFISIPFLALSAFLLIASLLLFCRSDQGPDEGDGGDTETAVTPA